MFLYGAGEKAMIKRTAKMGISHASSSEARPVLMSWKVIYLVGLRMLWPARMDITNYSLVSTHANALSVAYTCSLEHIQADNTLEREQLQQHSMFSQLRFVFATKSK